MWYEFKAHWLSLHDCLTQTLVYLQVTHSHVCFVIICTCNKYIPLICLLLIHKHLRFVYMKYIPGYTLSICLHIIHTHIQFVYMQYIHILCMHTHITTGHIFHGLFSDQFFLIISILLFFRLFPFFWQRLICKTSWVTGFVCHFFVATRSTCIRINCRKFVWMWIICNKYLLFITVQFFSVVCLERGQ